MTHGADPQLASLLVPLKSLRRDPNNARKHDTRSLGAVKASMKRFGQVRPILATRKGLVIAGNGTHQAAEELGWTHIAVVRSDHLSESDVEAAAYALADNRTAELSTFDYEQVSRLLQNLAASEAQADLGWDPDELEPLLQAEWTPPTPTNWEDPNPGGRQAGGLTLTFTADQATTIRQAIAGKMAGYSGPQRSEAQWMVQICQDTLTSAPQPAPKPKAAKKKAARRKKAPRSAS